MQTLSYDLCRNALTTIQRDCPHVLFQVQPDACFMLSVETERNKYVVSYCRYKGGIFSETYAEYVNTPSDVLEFCKQFITNP